MKIYQATINCPKFYDLCMTCHAHGWKNLAPFFWDDALKRILFTISLNNSSLDLVVQQKKNTLYVSCNSHKTITEFEEKHILSSVNRCTGVKFDTSVILRIAQKHGSQFSDLVMKGAGRLLRAPSLWEDAAKTLFTTNCSWALTKKICEVLCGEPFVSPSPNGSFPFPKPETIIKFSPQDLRRLSPIGYRADSLKKLAEIFVNDPSIKEIESCKYDYNTAFNKIIKLKGFGNYATTHLLVLSGYFQKVPIDTVAVSFLKKNYGMRKPESFINRHYKSWGEFKWWGFTLDKMIKRQNWLGD